MTERPDPGEGFRLVDPAKDIPNPEAEIWLPGSKQWHGRLTPENGYMGGAFYRVPDPVPEPVPLRWPDIPVSDDAWWLQSIPDPEPDHDSDVIMWVLGGLLFATGFILGWSCGG